MGDAVDAVKNPGFDAACGAGAAEAVVAAMDASMVEQLKAMGNGQHDETDVNTNHRKIDDVADTARNLTLSRHLNPVFPSQFAGDDGEAHSGEDIPQWLHDAASQVDPDEWAFPFRNLVMEGGGAKGLAYCGVLQYLEEVGVAGRLRRFGGASAGAISAALIALGYSSSELKNFMVNELPALSENLTYVPDFSKVNGYPWTWWPVISFVKSLLGSNGGLNRGQEFYDWFGKKIKAKSRNSDPDMTFFDLFREQDGKELLVVVTNLNLSNAGLCHPKTTPNLPIRDALRSSMAIPFFFEPWQMGGNRVYKDWFVDGGLLNNFPIFCYDGWWLSMKPEDSFTERLDIDDLRDSFRGAFYEPDGPNYKTLGCMLYEDHERDAMKHYLMQRKGVYEPEGMSKDEGKQGLEDDIASHKALVVAVKKFVNLLQKHNDLEVDGQITDGQLRAVMNEKELTPSELKLLFDETDTDRIIKSLKLNEGRISYLQLMSLMEKRGANLVDSLFGYGRREVSKNFTSIASSVMEATLLNITDQNVQAGDISRTMGIATGCVGTMDFEASPEMVEFATQRGRNAAKAFLKYFVAEHKDKPNMVRKKEDEERSEGA